MQESQEMWVRSLSQEDLEEEMATHSSILAWEIPWTEEPGGLQSMVLQRVRHDWAHTRARVICDWMLDIVNFILSVVEFLCSINFRSFF